MRNYPKRTPLSFPIPSTSFLMEKESKLHAQLCTTKPSMDIEEFKRVLQALLNKHSIPYQKKNHFVFDTRLEAFDFADDCEVYLNTRTKVYKDGYMIVQLLDLPPDYDN